MKLWPTRTGTATVASTATDATTYIVTDAAEQGETCDRCGPDVTALVSVIILPSGGLLTFCRHHARAYGFTS